MDEPNIGVEWWHYLTAIGFVCLIFWGWPLALFIFMMFSGAPGNP